MATQKSTAHPAHPSIQDHDDTVEAHYASLERPHACYQGVVYIGHVVEDVRQDHPHACLDGYVYLGYTTMDEETGDEVERVEALPCRRCAEGE
jgi:hypothetical protein